MNAIGGHRSNGPYQKTIRRFFDQRFDGAKLQVQAGVMVSRPWPFETIVMAIVVEQQKQLERLQSLLDDLQSRRQV
jgi:hypothetical protein